MAQQQQQPVTLQEAAGSALSFDIHMLQASKAAHPAASIPYEVLLRVLGLGSVNPKEREQVRVPISLQSFVFASADAVSAAALRGRNMVLTSDSKMTPSFVAASFLPRLPT